MSVQLRHPRLHDLRYGESAASHQPNRLLSPFAGFGTLKTSSQRGAPGMEHPAFTERLRKSFSSEPLDRQREVSSTSSSSDERAEHSLEATRLARRLHSASMNQIKSRSNLDKEVKFTDQDQHIEPTTLPTTLKMESMAADDVFTDMPPHRRLLAQSDSLSSPHVAGGGELTTYNDETQGIDAQGIYPPSACVFVANLTQLESDIVLESEVTRIFSEFGTVFVKIRRDQKNMPFAFCQFTTDHDARAAVAHSSGKIILGRPCRVEKAKANSTFILYKNSGGPIDESEAFYLMEPHGDIASIVPLDRETQNEMQLPRALLVQFRMYDPKRDVRHVSRRDPRFVVQEYEPAIAASPQVRRETRLRAEEMAEYDRDRRSAYFGNLPVDMTEDELSEMAIACGQIRNRRLYHKTYRTGPGAPVCFAFVEFARPDSVDEVIRAYHGSVVRGHMIKVERKLSRCFGDAAERDSRPSNRVSNYTPASKSWRASETDYAGPNRLPYTPMHTKHRHLPEPPVGKPALTTPHEKTYEAHAATFAHRRPQSQSFMIPSNSRRSAHETPTRPGHSASIFGTMRPRAPARLHAKDIFAQPDEQQNGATSRPFHQQESFIQAHRDALASYQRKEAFANEVREASRNDAQEKMNVESWINHQNMIKTAELVQEMYQGKFAGTLPRTVPGTLPGRLPQKLAPSEDGTDNESGGAMISPETQPSTLADMSSVPDVSAMSISDESAKPRVQHHVQQNIKYHDQPPPYYGFPHMAAVHPLQMHHPLSPSGPPVTPYSQYAHHTVTGGRMMPFLPTPFPDIQGNVMISPAYPLHAGVRQELDPVTPTRFGPVGSARVQGSVRGRGKAEKQADDVKSTAIEASPSRAAETPRFQAQCHARRESQETQYEPEKSSGNSSNTNDESEE